MSYSVLLYSVLSLGPVRFLFLEVVSLAKRVVSCSWLYFLCSASPYGRRASDTSLIGFFFFSFTAFQTEGKLYLILDFLRGGDVFTRLSKEVSVLFSSVLTS